MRVLFATGHPHLPQLIGGAQATTHAFAKELIGKGHEVAILAGMTRRGFVGRRAQLVSKLLKRRSVRDNALGYPTYRSWLPWEAAPSLVDELQPDVVVLQNGAAVQIAHELRDKVPTVFYLHDVQFNGLGGDITAFRHCRFIANSRFTADRYFEEFGIRAAVINPIFRCGDYRTVPGDMVTFINPIPMKGLELALEIARLCPEIPFQFVRAWSISPAQLNDLATAIRGLPNVRLRRSTMDMKSIYARTRILIAPSRCEEAWGRVASEAHFSGIPVLATDCGGLSEAVGPGGVRFDPGATAEEWARALRKLLSDGDAYSNLSQAALRYSARSELDPDSQVRSLLEILEEASGRLQAKVSAQAS